jgi:predicted transglutaminase-like cysteine proteinase
MFLRGLALASALLIPSPSATAQEPATPPVDQIARAKFPHDPGKEIDTLEMINRAINGSIQYEDDKPHYGIDELWVMFPPDSKGDCEDYALTKLGVLSMAGFPIVMDAKIVTLIVHHPKTPNADKTVDDGHAILAVRLPSGAVAYMDNMNDELMTRPELVAQGYRFFDWTA